MALSGRRPERLRPPERQTKCVLVPGEATLRLMLLDRLIQVEDIISTEGKSSFSCGMIIFRGIWSRGVTLALEG